MKMARLLTIAVVVALVAATAQAQLPSLVMPDEWNGESWIFYPPKGCGIDPDDIIDPPSNPPPARDPDIGPIVGFRFTILSQAYHYFYGVGVAAGFNGDLDGAELRVIPGAGAPEEIIHSSFWPPVDTDMNGVPDDWVVWGFGSTVKSFEIRWDDPGLFFDPMTPEGRRVFPVWWSVTPYDCQATVAMTPISGGIIPEPATVVLLALGALGLAAVARHRP